MARKDINRSLETDYLIQEYTCEKTSASLVVSVANKRGHDRTRFCHLLVIGSSELDISHQYMEIKNAPQHGSNNFKGVGVNFTSLFCSVDGTPSLT